MLMDNGKEEQNRAGWSHSPSSGLHAQDEAANIFAAAQPAARSCAVTSVRAWHAKLLLLPLLTDGA